MPVESYTPTGGGYVALDPYHLRIAAGSDPDTDGPTYGGHTVRATDGVNGKNKPSPSSSYASASEYITSQADVTDCIAVRDNKPPDWVKIRPLIVDALLVLAVIWCVGWAGVFLFGWFGKYGLEPAENYRYYLTNWSWTLQALYYSVKGVGLIFRSRYITAFVYMFMFWPTWIISNAVSIMVVFVIVDNPDMLVELFRKYGAATVLGMDRVYHVIPVAVLTIDVILSLRYLVGWFWLRDRSVWIMILLQVVFTHCVVLFYMGMNDMHAVYGLHHLRWWELCLVFELTLLLVGVLFMYALSQFKKLGGFNFNS